MRFMSLLACLLLSIIVAGCDNSGSAAKPGGTAAPATSGGATDATYVEASGKSTLVLKPDNTFTMDTSKKQHITGTYKIAGDKITLDGKGDDEKTIAMIVNGSIRGDEIRLQFGPTEQVLRKK